MVLSTVYLSALVAHALSGDDLARQNLAISSQRRTATLDARGFSRRSSDGAAGRSLARKGEAFVAIGDGRIHFQGPRGAGPPRPPAWSVLSDRRRCPSCEDRSSGRLGLCRACPPS